MKAGFSISPKIIISVYCPELNVELEKYDQANTNCYIIQRLLSHVQSGNPYCTHVLNGLYSGGGGSCAGVALPVGGTPSGIPDAALSTCSNSI